MQTIPIPVHYAVRKDEANPLWKEYIKFLNDSSFNMDFTGNSENYPFYGYDGMYDNKGFMERFAKGTVQLTLQQWHDTFIKPNTVQKKIIGYKAKTEEFGKYAATIANTSFALTRPYDFTPESQTCKKLKDCAVLDVWFDPVYEEEETAIRMGILRTFVLKVKNGKVFHNTDDITEYVKEIQRTYGTFLQPRNIGAYTFEPSDMIIKKTGCENIPTNLSEWLAIKLD